MDIFRTEPKRCTKKSWETMILPPAPNERDYSTCESCRVWDTASKKKRKRDSTIAEELCLKQVGATVQEYKTERAVHQPQAEEVRIVEQWLKISCQKWVPIPSYNYCTYLIHQTKSPVKYVDSQGLFDALWDIFKHQKHIDFFGTYNLLEDPLVSDSERVRMTMHKVWKIVGYCFM